MEGLTEGRIVHYVLATGEHRSALVVRNWGGADGNVNLIVFLDGTNDAGSGLPLPGGGPVASGDGMQALWWCTSVHYSETPAPYTWHWPERV